MKINQIYLGDCVKVMQGFDENSIDSIVTDPPYGIGFMGKEWDNFKPKEVKKSKILTYKTDYIDGIPVKRKKPEWVTRDSGARVAGSYDFSLTGNRKFQEWFTMFSKECLRILKPGGHLLSFGGTRTYHRMVCAIEDAGFEIRDTLQWIFGQGFPKSLDISKSIDKIKGAKREVIGKMKNPASAKKGTFNCSFDKSKAIITAPSTPEAKQWDGWGTGLKPSHEILCYAQKPFENKDFGTILARDIMNIIINELCQLKLFVKIAERNLKSNQKESEGVMSDIVQWIADESTNIQDVLNVVMATLQSKLMENTNLNIVSFWLNILVELYNQMKIPTTKMVLEMTTELKILKSLPLQNILKSIIKDGIKQNGEDINVLRAVNIFNAVKMKLDYIQEHFAEENALLKAKNLDLFPNCNPIVLARKPISEKNIALNVLKWGTGGINIDGGRIEHNEEQKTTKRKQRSAGWNMDNCGFDSEKNETASANKKGRFPSNVLLDEKAAELLNSAFRFFYVAKASKSERNAGLEGFEGQPAYDYGSIKKSIGRHGENTPRQNNHPTVKPIKLMRYLVRLITPPGGICLDPFVGSGTTPIACIEEGFDYIAIEKEKEYFDIAEKRIFHYKRELKLF